MCAGPRVRDRQACARWPDQLRLDGTCCAVEFARLLEFDWFCGGHGNIGEKSDFDFYLSYLDEVASLVNEYVPRPAEVPDLSLTDYLAGLDTETRSRLLSQLDNHFGLYLYGR